MVVQRVMPTESALTFRRLITGRKRQRRQKLQHQKRKKSRSRRRPESLLPTHSYCGKCSDIRKVEAPGTATS